MTTDTFEINFSLTLDNFSLDIDCQLPNKGIIGLFGRSGSGKTTLLRCLAGLEKPSKGKLIFNSETWQNDHTFIPTHKRPIGYVFQEASLFPHLNVQQNLKYARKRTNDSAQVRYEELIEILNIQKLLNHKAHQLSGGERQRVAIARAVLINPQLLLMDEPLASLDAEHKQEILPYLDQLHQELSIPVIYVSHSIDEIARLADHLIVLEKGRVVVNDSITHALARLDFPINLGDDLGVIVMGEVAEIDKQWKLMRINFDGGDIWIPENDSSIGQQVRLRILAKDVSLASDKHQSSILNVLSGTISEINQSPEAASALIKVALGSNFITSKITLRSLSQLDLKVGDSTWVQIKSVALVQ